MSILSGKVEKSSEWLKEGSKNTRAEQARINGKRSRGPKTKEGKEKSSKNAVKHNLASEDFVLLEGEDPERYERLHASFVESYKPEGEHELSLVELIAQLEWKCKRCCRLESKSIAGRIQLYGSDEAYATTRPGFTENLVAYSRYLSNLRLNIRRAEQDLERHQQRRKAEITERTQQSGAAVPAASSPVSHQRPAGETSERGVLACPERSRRVSTALEEPHDPRSPGAEEPKQKNTKRTQAEAESSRLAPHASRLTSSEPQSPRAAEPPSTHPNNQDANNQQPITKRTQILNHEVVASPSEGFEAQRRTLVEGAPTTPTLEGLSPEKPAKRKNTKRTQTAPESSRLTPHASRLNPRLQNWTPPTPPFPLWVADEARTRDYARRMKADPDA